MKKLFPALFLALVLCLISCIDEKTIKFEKLPQKAQDIVNTYFVKSNVLMITEKTVQSGKLIEIRLNDESELEFDGNGKLLKVDCKGGRVPDKLIPAEIMKQVQASYPEAFVVEWKKDGNRWKAKLNNNVEMDFDEQNQ